MSHWPESWRSPDLRSQPRNISTGCKRQSRSTMCSMARNPRRRADPDPSGGSSSSGSGVNTGNSPNQ